MERKVRKNTRLKNYDYANPGLYFITLCCKDMACLFGNISDGKFYPNAAGKIVYDSWLESEQVRKDISLHEFVIMPNHFHAIVEIKDCRGSLSEPSDVERSINTKLGSVVAGFKSSVTKRVREARNQKNFQVWQRNYHDHVIRNEEALEKIQEYVINNPVKWELDRYYIARD